MEWELILQFDWEHLFFTLSLVLGIATFTVTVQARTIKKNFLRFKIDVTRSTNKININWIKFPFSHPLKIYKILMKFIVTGDELSKYVDRLPKVCN